MASLERNKGIELFNLGRFSEALPILEELARNGDSSSQVMVGWMLLRGTGIAKDSLQAEVWFRRAADMGSPEGQYYSARMAFSAGNIGDAMTLFARSAEARFGPALLWLGMIHLRGLGIPENCEKGIEFLERASELGNLMAKRELAMLSLRGARGFWQIPVGIISLPYVVAKSYIVAARRGPSDALAA